MIASLTENKRVYPRVGGETSQSAELSQPLEGLSPRGRGNPPGPAAGAGRPRSIPAWAGKPWEAWNRLPMSRVYPRVGGETRHWTQTSCSSTGLSPRGRGNRIHISHESRRERSIPAWAGKPNDSTTTFVRMGVYPRVGGETSCSCRACRWRYGLSPRGRGNRYHRGRRQQRIGSIPAWAGKPRSYRSASSRPAVYPRVGGETSRTANSRPRGTGLSPRGRGNRVVSSAAVVSARSIPAWAGKPAGAGAGKRSSEVYPRVGGETPLLYQDRVPAEGLSPRGRGNRAGQRADQGRARSIPAWAGKPCTAARARGRWQVYPRVGGETGYPRGAPGAIDGLSPRGRGNRLAARSKARRYGSIPAWAGKPPTAPCRGSVERVYPRVGGETYISRRGIGEIQGLSPRGRGNRRPGAAAAAGDGSIPAWAGKPG